MTLKGVMHTGIAILGVIFWIDMLFRVIRDNG